MKYSIILCYRDRELHLKKSVPAIRKWFTSRNLDHEIIVVEQNDLFAFRRGALFNHGAHHSTGDVLIFHDVDYVPTDVETYFDPSFDVYLPVKRVSFLDENDTPRKEHDIPAGYRKFSESVDDNFFGGVISFRRDKFFEINGFNPAYAGWGLEDEDLRERIAAGSLSVSRSPDGHFSALYHPDSHPGDTALEFNQTIFKNREQYRSAGVMTQKYPIEYCRTDVLVDSNIDFWQSVVGPPAISNKATADLRKLALAYTNTKHGHATIWNTFKYNVNHAPELKHHRDWVVQYEWGYGNRAFHWLWNMLVADAPQHFRFLEIGVFKGQIISLISLLNTMYKKHGAVYGITPLNRTGDKYNLHPESDYEHDIATIYAHFGLDATDLNIIHGLSTDVDVKQITEQSSPYDLLYVDGGHDYDTVVSDIQTYSPMVRVGGYIVMDDASNDLNIPDGLIRNNWRGLPDVTKAVIDVLDKDNRFSFKFAVGHNKIYQRTS